jgi:DNA-binding NarL/FixJ family response regulator
MRILLADDHPLFRSGVRALLEALDGYTVVGEAREGEEALRLCRELQPDLVLLDLRLPGLGGLEVATRLREEGSPVRVLILSAHTDDDYVQQALRLGVAGYLAKDSTGGELETALETVARGGLFLSPTISQRVVHAYLRNVPEATPDLTPRQRDVVRLIAQGCNTKEIAHRLGVSVRTVDTHRAQIMERLGINSVAGLTRYALRAGLISEEHEE